VAGIGFELRKLLRKESYTSLFQAYAYAGIISSGPWILSIIGILAIGMLSVSVVLPNFQIVQFQISVTYIMVSSLVLTGGVQLAFTRFVADRLYEKKDGMVLPNFNGLLLLVIVVSGVLGILAVLTLFQNESDAYRVLLLAGFVIMCCIWVATLFLSGMKQYKEIVYLFALGYAITVASALVLRPLGLEGLLLGFVIGHFVLLMGMIVMTLRNYPSDHFIAFEFMKKGAMYPTLMITGLFYNLGVWADKLLFWYFPDTGQAIIGPLRASLIYDLPVFLAYLAIIPGMAVFLVRIETDFVEYFQKFYDSVRDGGSLDFIEQMRDEMVFTIRQALFEIIKIQSMAVLIVFVAGPTLLNLLGISRLYLPLLYVDVAYVMFLTALFLILNLGLTAVTLQLGAAFYGYGFAVALLITVVVAMQLLEKKLARLEYETFMLQ
jgi:uncharacterized membrane protein